jgi:hypothetical protein
MTHEIIARFEGGFVQSFSYENKSVEEITNLFRAANENNPKFKAVVLTVKCIENGEVNIIDL